MSPRDSPNNPPNFGLIVARFRVPRYDESGETLHGVLRSVEVRVGPNTRDIPLRLVIDEVEFSVYTSGFDLTALRPFIDRSVEVVGKRADLGSEGFGVEVWIATIALY